VHKGFWAQEKQKSGKKQRNHFKVFNPNWRTVKTFWWNTPVIPALRRLRQEDLEFKASQVYSETPSNMHIFEKN
jgi:hypothetical protein